MKLYRTGFESNSSITGLTYRDGSVVRRLGRLNTNSKALVFNSAVRNSIAAHSGYTSLSGTCSASHESSGSYAWHMVDGRADTCTQVTPGVVTDCWVKYDFIYPFAATSIFINNNDTAINSGTVFQGYDGASWVTLYTFPNSFTSTVAGQTITFTNSTSYFSYRLFKNASCDWRIYQFNIMGPTIAYGDQVYLDAALPTNTTKVSGSYFTKASNPLTEPITLVRAGNVNLKLLGLNEIGIDIDGDGTCETSSAIGPGSISGTGKTPTTGGYGYNASTIYPTSCSDVNATGAWVKVTATGSNGSITSFEFDSSTNSGYEEGDTITILSSNGVGSGTATYIVQRSDVTCLKPYCYTSVCFTIDLAQGATTTLSINNIATVSSTVSATDSSVSSVRIYGFSGTASYLDDLAINDGSGSLDTEVPPLTHSVVGVPTSVGDQSEWSSAEFFAPSTSMANLPDARTKHGLFLTPSGIICGQQNTDSTKIIINYMPDSPLGTATTGYAYIASNTTPRYIPYASSTYQALGYCVSKDLIYYAVSSTDSSLISIWAYSPLLMRIYPNLAYFNNDFDGSAVTTVNYMSYLEPLDKFIITTNKGIWVFDPQNNYLTRTRLDVDDTSGGKAIYIPTNNRIWITFTSGKVRIIDPSNYFAYESTITAYSHAMAYDMIYHAALGRVVRLAAPGAVEAISTDGTVVQIIGTPGTLSPPLSYHEKTGSVVIGTTAGNMHVILPSGALKTVTMSLAPAWNYYSDLFIVPQQLYNYDGICVATSASATGRYLPFVPTNCHLTTIESPSIVDVIVASDSMKITTASSSKTQNITFTSYPIVTPSGFSGATIDIGGISGTFNIEAGWRDSSDNIHTLPDVVQVSKTTPTSVQKSILYRDETTSLTLGDLNNFQTHIKSV